MSLFRVHRASSTPRVAVPPLSAGKWLPPRVSTVPITGIHGFAGWWMNGRSFQAAETDRIPPCIVSIVSGRRYLDAR